jgi:hypothetical protein
MNQAGIIETLQQHLTPQTIQQMSNALGTSPAATSSAISMALPALLGGLASNASHPQGAAALNDALDDHDGSILNNLGGILSGAAASGIGGAILGHIFGGNRGTVEQGVAKSSGLNAQQVAQLLAMLAPIVMGVLGRMKQQGAPVTTQLQREAPAATDLGGLAASVLGGLFGNKS